MKKIIVFFITLIFLCGCSEVCSFTAMVIKGNSKEPKDICEYVAKTVSANTGKNIKIDYPSLSVYNIGIIKRKEVIKGRRIIADCKIDNIKYFVQIIEFKCKDHYEVLFTMSNKQ